MIILTREDDLERLMSKIWKANFADRQVHWRYFRSNNHTNKSRAKDRYMWTTQTTIVNGKPRYTSGVYRFNASQGKRGGWRLLKKRHHAKRVDAKARALKLCKQEANGVT